MWRRSLEELFDRAVASLRLGAHLFVDQQLRIIHHVHNKTCPISN
jgi:hypothetical protein